MHKVDQLFIQKRMITELLSKAAKGIVSLEDIRDEFSSMYERIGKRFFTILAHELKNRDIGPAELSVALLSLIPENGSTENLIQLFRNQNFSGIAMSMLSAALEELGLDNRDILLPGSEIGFTLNDAYPKNENALEVIEDIDAAIHNFIELPEEKQIKMIDLLLSQNHPNAAFFLAEVETFDLKKEVKRSIRKAIYKLRGRNIPIPDRAAIVKDHLKRFYKAYSSQTRDTGELVLYIAWKNSRDTLNIMVFLLNFNNSGIEEYHMIREAEYSDLECIVFGNGYTPESEGMESQNSSDYIHIWVSDEDDDEEYDEEYSGSYCGFDKCDDDAVYATGYESDYDSDCNGDYDNGYHREYAEDESLKYEGVCDINMIKDGFLNEEGSLPFVEISLEDAISLISLAYRTGKRRSDSRPLSFDLYRWLMPEDQDAGQSCISPINAYHSFRVRDLMNNLYTGNGLSFDGFIQGFVMSLIRRDYSLIYYYYADSSWLSGYDSEEIFYDHLDGLFLQGSLFYTGYKVDNISRRSDTAIVDITLFGNLKESRIQRKIRLAIRCDSDRMSLINLDSSSIIDSVL